MTPPERSLKQQSTTPTAFYPTDEQQARVAAMQRFTRLYVYLPLGMATAVVVILTLYLLYLAVFPTTEDTRLVLSGLADFILVLWLLPVVLIFGLVMTAVCGGYLYYWYGLDETQRPIPPAPAYGRVRALLWRIDNLLVRLLPRLNEVLTYLSWPIIRFNAWLTYGASWLNSLKNVLLRR